MIYIETYNEKKKKVFLSYIHVDSCLRDRSYFRPLMVRKKFLVWRVEGLEVWFEGSGPSWENLWKDQVLFSLFLLPRVTYIMLIFLRVERGFTKCLVSFSPSFHTLHTSRSFFPVTFSSTSIISLSKYCTLLLFMSKEAAICVSNLSSF